MSVSTKVPTSRAGASPSGPPPGPIPVPRVVGNRRIRAGGIALAVMLLALGAALSGVALISASKTSSYLAIAKAVPKGTLIDATDFSKVELRGGAGLQAIPSDQISFLVNLYSAVDLVPGALAVHDDFQKHPFANGDDSVVTFPLSAGHVPNPLSIGDPIYLVPVGGNATADQKYTVTIVTITKTDADGGVQLNVAVAPIDLTGVSVLVNSGSFIVATTPKGN